MGWRRLVSVAWSVASIIVVFAVVFALLGLARAVAETEIIVALIELVGGLVLPGLVLVLATMFRAEIKAIIEGIRDRVNQGDPLEITVGGVKINLGKLAYVPPDGFEFTASEGIEITVSEITVSMDGVQVRSAGSDASAEDWTRRRRQIYERNRNVHLAHIFRPSRDPAQQFDIFIFLVGDKRRGQAFRDVSYAEFYFGGHWNNNVFRVNNEDGPIGISTSAYGPFLCLCRVTFTDGYEVVLDRYIDFAMSSATPLATR